MTGLAAERKVTNALRDENYLVGSLRHIEGPGDMIALPVLTRAQPPLLVEVKCTLGPFDHFGPTDRGAMLLAGDAWGAEPMLAWVTLISGAYRILWLDVDSWPMTIYPAQGASDSALTSVRR